MIPQLIEKQSEVYGAPGTVLKTERDLIFSSLNNITEISEEASMLFKDSVLKEKNKHLIRLSGDNVYLSRELGEGETIEFVSTSDNIKSIVVNNEIVNYTYLDGSVVEDGFFKKDIIFSLSKYNSVYVVKETSDLLTGDLEIKTNGLNKNDIVVGDHNFRDCYLEEHAMSESLYVTVHIPGVNPIEGEHNVFEVTIKGEFTKTVEGVEHLIFITLKYLCHVDYLNTAMIIKNGQYVTCDTLDVKNEPVFVYNNWYKVNDRSLGVRLLARIKEYNKWKVIGNGYANVDYIGTTNSNDNMYTDKVIIDSNIDDIVYTGNTHYANTIPTSIVSHVSMDEIDIIHSNICKETWNGLDEESSLWSLLYTNKPLLCEYVGYKGSDEIYYLLTNRGRYFSKQLLYTTTGELVDTRYLKTEYYNVLIGDWYTDIIKNEVGIDGDYTFSDIVNDAKTLLEDNENILPSKGRHVDDIDEFTLLPYTGSEVDKQTLTIESANLYFVKKGEENQAPTIEVDGFSGVEDNATNGTSVSMLDISDMSYNLNNGEEEFFDSYICDDDVVTLSHTNRLPLESMYGDLESGKTIEHNKSVNNIHITANQERYIVESSKDVFTIVYPDSTGNELDETQSGHVVTTGSDSPLFIKTPYDEDVDSDTYTTSRPGSVTGYNMSSNIVPTLVTGDTEVTGVIINDFDTTAGNHGSQNHKYAYQTARDLETGEVVTFKKRKRTLDIKAPVISPNNSMINDEHHFLTNGGIITLSNNNDTPSILHNNIKIRVSKRVYPSDWDSKLQSDAFITRDNKLYVMALSDDAYGYDPDNVNKYNLIDDVDVSSVGGIYFVNNQIVFIINDTTLKFSIPMNKEHCAFSNETGGGYGDITLYTTVQNVVIFPSGVAWSYNSGDTTIFEEMSHNTNYERTEFYSCDSSLGMVLREVSSVSSRQSTPVITAGDGKIYVFARDTEIEVRTGDDAVEPLLSLGSGNELVDATPVYGDSRSKIYTSPGGSTIVTHSYEGDNICVITLNNNWNTNTSYLSRVSNVMTAHHTTRSYKQCMVSDYAVYLLSNTNEVIQIMYLTPDYDNDSYNKNFNLQRTIINFPSKIVALINGSTSGSLLPCAVGEDGSRYNLTPNMGYKMEHVKSKDYNGMPGSNINYSKAPLPGDYTISKQHNLLKMKGN